MVAPVTLAELVDITEDPFIVAVFKVAPCRADALSVHLAVDMYLMSLALLPVSATVVGLISSTVLVVICGPLELLVADTVNEQVVELPSCVVLDVPEYVLHVNVHTPDVADGM